jgi:hypothetical protein
VKFGKHHACNLAWTSGGQQDSLEGQCDDLCRFNFRVDKRGEKRPNLVRCQDPILRPFSFLGQADLLFWHIGGRRPLSGLAFAITTQLIGIVQHGLA